MPVLNTLKIVAQRVPGFWPAYQAVKRQAIRMMCAAYYLSDMARVWRHMHWPADGEQYWALSAELLFQYHKLEKGLVMPGEPRVFGTDPSRATMRLIERWERAGHRTSDPVYRGALATLSSYAQLLTRRGLSTTAPSHTEVVAFLTSRQQTLDEVEDKLSTPIELHVPATGSDDDAFVAFRELALSRRSVRDYSQQAVSLADVEEAVTLASLAPSACNRQPNKVLLIKEPASIAAALALQNGNRGFGHKTPLLAVLTSDTSGFFDGTERHQPYIDGGLFAMSFMLALSSKGLASCPLNWCVTPGTDRRLRRLLALPDSEVVLMMMSIGYAPAGALVPRSPRRDRASIVRMA